METNEYEMFEICDVEGNVVEEFNNQHFAEKTALMFANRDNVVYKVFLKRVKTTRKLIGNLVPQK